MDKTKYYRLLNETDSNIIGDEPVQSTLLDCDESNLILGKGLYEPLIGIETIKCIHLFEESIVTDLMMVGALSQYGFLVSSKMKGVLESYKLNEIQFVDVEFTNRKEVEGYSFMFFNSNLCNIIDFEKAKFGIEELSFYSDEGETSPLSYDENNLNNLIELSKKYAGSISYRLNVLNKYLFKESMNSDVFRIGHFDDNFYFSEEVCNELFRLNLTGFNFKESPYF